MMSPDGRVAPAADATSATDSGHTPGRVGGPASAEANVGSAPLNPRSSEKLTKQAQKRQRYRDLFSSVYGNQ
mgnify:CR=1 FL=1